MTKILIAMAILIAGLAATATPAAAECTRLTSDPASPCREVQAVEAPVVEYSVGIERDQCVVKVEWTNPPSVGSGHISLKDHPTHPSRKSLYHDSPVFVRAYSLQEAYSHSGFIYPPELSHRHRLTARQNGPGFSAQWQVQYSRAQVWRRQEIRYGISEKFPFQGWYASDAQSELFDCAQELEDKLERADEAARVTAEQRAIAVEARERELELNRRLLIQVNDLKLAQERLASEVKLQEKETRITAEIVALQKRLIETRIATQEAILSGLERRAEIIRTGALERNDAMQEFLLQSGSRYDDIEAKQAETAAVLRELRAGFAETQRRNEAALEAQEELLLESERQEAEIAAELADKEAELQTAGGGE